MKITDAGKGAIMIRRVEDDFAALLMAQAITNVGGRVISVVYENDPRFTLRWHVMGEVADEDTIHLADEAYSAFREQK